MNGRVRIDIDAKQYEGTILSEKVSSTGLVKIQVDNGGVSFTIARHVDRIVALDDAAKKFLGK